MNGSDTNITQTGGQQGTMNWATSGGAGTPSGTYPGILSMLLPNQLIKFTWYQVPYRFLAPAVRKDGSYFTRFLNHINQDTVSWCGFTFPPGSLLYLGYNPIKYNPPNNVVQAANGAVTYAKLCDIEFTMLYTRRYGQALPSAPLNGNYVMGGHNLLPWFPVKQYFYATGTKIRSYDTSDYPPQYNSRPFQVMLSDPDYAGNINAQL
jgi:hypothetical protein